MTEHNKIRPWRWRVGIVTVLAMTAVMAAEAPASSPVSVDIRAFTFAPATLTVSAGTTVTWTNHDEEPHTVTSTNGAFRSTGLANEETFSETFADPGTYQYFCALHPHMKATVIVK